MRPNGRNAKTAAVRPRFLQQEKRRGKNEKDENQKKKFLYRLILLYRQDVKEKSGKILSSYEVL